MYANSYPKFAQGNKREKIREGVLKIVFVSAIYVLFITTKYLLEL